MTTTETASLPGSEPPLLKRLSIAGVIRFACAANLLSLALMSWSVLDPTPLPVMVSMSVGHALGSLALASYLGAVLLYQLRQLRVRRRSARPP